jgi:hypothetical protein
VLLRNSERFWVRVLVASEEYSASPVNGIVDSSPV